MFFSPQVKRSTTNNNKLVYTSHLTSYRKTHPHGIIAAGGALAPTQEKKKKGLRSQEIRKAQETIKTS